MFRKLCLPSVGVAVLAIVSSGSPRLAAANDDQQNQDQPNQQQDQSSRDRDRDRDQHGDQNAQKDQETQYRGAEHAALGVILSEREGQGVRIREILPDSPAESAGLELGDRISKIDDQQMNSYREVVDYLNHAKPQQAATITVKRDGKDKTIKLTLASRRHVYGHETQYSQRQGNSRGVGNWQEKQDGRDSERRGMNRNEQQQASLGVDLQAERNALVVREVHRNSAAAQAGLRPGDELEALDDQSIRNRGDLRQQLSNHQPGDRVNLTIRRNARERTLAMNLESRQESNQSSDRQNAMQSRNERDQYNNRQFASRGRTGYQRWSISQNHVALGVTLEESDDGYLTIAHVMQNGPARQAGLQSGDEILTIDDHPVNSVRDVMQQLSRKNADDKVDVQIRRNGKKRDIDVTLKDSADLYNDQRTASRDERDDNRDGDQRNRNAQDRNNDQGQTRSDNDRD